MGLGGISIWQLLIILLIVALIFGTKRLHGMSDDDTPEKSDEKVSEDEKTNSDKK